MAVKRAPETFADRLRRLRAAAGLSQRALATAAGIRQATLGEIESGRTDPRLSTLQGLASALRTSVAVLCGE